VRGSRRPSVLLWLAPLAFAAWIANWALARHETDLGTIALERRAEPPASAKAMRAKLVRSEEGALSAGNARLAGQLTAPSGLPSVAGVPVHLAREEMLALASPSAWRCCQECSFDLVDDACERAAQVIAQMIAFGMSEVKPARTALTAADGRFDFGALPRGRYAVWGAAPKGTIALARDVEVVERAHAEVALASEYRASLSGSVLRSVDGRPIAGAAVSALDVRLGVAFEAKTDERGTFEINGLDRRETYYLTASARGMAPEGKANVAPEEDLLFELGEAASLFGSVMQDGAPIVRASVDLDDGVRNAETATDGAFRFDGLSPGMHVLDVAAEKHLGRRLELELSRGLGRSMVVELARTCPLSVRVLDPRGSPIPDADVRLLARNSVDHRAAKTNDMGMVSFEQLTIGAYDVDASRFDRGKSSLAMRVDPSCRREAITIVIREGPGLKGHVIDDRRHAVTNAAIEAERIGQREDDGEDEPRSTHTDRDGAFRLSSLTPGKWELTASKPGYVDGAASFEVIEKKGDVDIVLTLSHGGQIHGHVRDVDDRPVAGWLVSALIPGMDPIDDEPAIGTFTFGQRTTSGDDGSFVFLGLAEQIYEVYAEPRSINHERASSALRTQVISTRTGERDVVLRTHGTGELGGTVRFRGAKVPESFTVELPAIGIRAFDGASEHFRFANALASTYPIQIRAHGFSAARLDVVVPAKGRKEIEVTLHASARLTGRVIDARDGQPVAEAVVGSWAAKKPGESDQPIASVTSRRDGRFELRDLTPGEHLLRIRAEGYATGEVGPFALESGKDHPPIEIRLGHTHP
jgi:protocatechuate 3,4-dioxygenase beta subunit